MTPVSSPLFPGGNFSLRLGALSAEGASALLLASVGVSWAFRPSGKMWTRWPCSNAKSLLKRPFPSLFLKTHWTRLTSSTSPLGHPRGSWRNRVFGFEPRAGVALRRSRTWGVPAAPVPARPPSVGRAASGLELRGRPLGCPRSIRRKSSRQIWQDPQ